MSDSSSASPFSFLFDGRPSLLLRPFPVLFVYSLFAGVSPVFMVDPASVGGLKVFGLLRFGLVNVVVAALVAVLLWLLVVYATGCSSLASGLFMFVFRD
ncbi:hypothetical protein QL285_059007 [Trifolium repens]|nr:hypothetical protein QL285_059007 [Trifolium repens]